ncbi:MAG: hypothetical protein K5892_06675 [Acholeplasmatales bacterium]|nr:hypothetical protein [Acholeplasmatales bacterium]
MEKSVETDFTFDNKKSAQIAVTNSILNEGIISFYNKNKKSDIDYNRRLLDRLYDFQRAYFRELRDNLEIISKNFSTEFKSINVVEAINGAYLNLKDVYIKNYGNEIDNYTKGKTSYFVSMILILHNICKKINFFEKEKNELSSLVSEYCCLSFTDEYNKLLQLFVNILVDNVKTGDLFFLYLIRDNNEHPRAVFSENKSILGIFISMYMGFILNKKLLSNEVLNKYKQFVNESTKGLNSDGSTWKNIVLSFMSYDSLNISELIFALIRYFEVIEDSNYIIFENNASWLSNEFNKRSVIDAWLEVVLYDNSSINLDELKETISKIELDQNLQELFYDVLRNDWIVDGKIKREKLVYLNLFDVQVDEVANEYYNQEIIEYLINKHIEYHKNILFKQVKKGTIDERSYKNLVKNQFDEYANNNEFYDSTINLESEKYYNFVLKINKDSSNQIIEAYIRQFPQTLDYMFRKDIEENIKPEKYNSKLDNDTLSKIVMYDNNYCGYIRFNLANTNQFKKIKDNIKRVNSQIIPQDFFFMKNSIKLKVEFDYEKSYIRCMNENEINAYIDKECQIINGYYKYNRYSNDDKHSVLLTRDEIKKFLKENVRYFFIVFKKKLVINEQDCLWLIKQNDN